MTYSLELDHLVVAARSLDEGAAYVEAVLGVSLAPGGRHDQMGTHNRLLSLGSDCYLEVIAIDDEAAKPKHRRWFNLDARTGSPRMTNWVCRTDDLERALEDAPAGCGKPMAFSRGSLRWQMAVSEFGRLPFDDAMPALMQWEDGPHPASRLPDHGLRLTRLDVFHPDADGLSEAFPNLTRVDRAMMREGPEKRLIASISTPDGTRVLA